MMPKCLTVLATLLVIAGFNYVSSAGSKKVVCYFGSWAGYRPDQGKFEVEYIDPTLCTHLIYTFVGVSLEGGVKILDAWNDLPNDGGKDAFARFNKLRTKNPTTKTLIAIGGWNEGSYGFSTVVNNPATRATFVNNIVAFVQKYGFDGFDLDWEYPAQRGGVSTDKAAFSQLVQELRAAFDKHGLLLSAAVGVGRYLVDSSYDVAVLSKNLDFINMMAYDLHGTWDGVTGENSPLYASSADTTEAARYLNVNSSIHFWLENGAAPEKMVLGMGTYGRSFTLSNPAQNGIGAPSTGPGEAGPYTREAGMLGYNEICQKTKNGGWTVTWNDEQKVPYAVNGNQWVGYDNVESIKMKAEFAQSLGLGGAMIWSVETDDFLGLCGTKYPLLHAINDVFNGGSSGGGGGDTSSTSSTTTSTTTPSTTTGSSGGSGGDPTGLCTKAGFVRDPENCQIFYQCVLINGAYVPSEFHCADGLAFDTTIEACNYKSQVNC